MGLHTTIEEAAAILKEAEARQDWGWSHQTLDEGAVGYVGQAGTKFVLTVVRWFDDEVARYDGAVARFATIVHLTAEQAERLWKRAEQEERETS